MTLIPFSKMLGPRDIKSTVRRLQRFHADPKAFLAKIDQQMIEQQLPSYPLDTCMVSGDKLGGDMGKPVNIIYKNRLVRFCCPDCVPDFKKEDVLHMPYDGTLKGSADAFPAFITAHPEVTHWVLWSCNDDGVLGAVRSLENAGVILRHCIQ